MLDSGAFSAWNKGRPHGIDRVRASYADFLNTAAQLGVGFDEVWLVNLDVIPGRRGVSASSE